MSVAQKFLEELKEGKLDEAIETIHAGLNEATQHNISERRNEILEEYGFGKVDEASFKVDDKVEIGHVDPNNPSEVTFKGDTSVGTITRIDKAKGKAMVYDASEGEAEWTDFAHIRKIS